MATPSYLPSLISSESGGNWAAQNNAMGAGGMAGHFGRVQFGRARLQDAMNAGAIPFGTTPEQFMASPDLQMAAEKWHFADLERQLAPLVGTVVNGKPMDMAALVAMGHLGGAGGARKYVESGGAYNPSDAYGTSLSDYAGKHGGGGGGGSNGGAPMGLLEVPQQDPTGLVGLLTGKQKPWAGKLNDIGAVLLALSGSPAAQPIMAQLNQRKEAQRADAKANQTAAWLASVDRDDLAQAMMAGGLSAEDATQMALTTAPGATPVELKTFTGPDGTVYSFNPVTGETKPMTGAEAPGAGAAPATFGTTLQFFTDPNGKTRAGVLGSDGTMKEIQPPDGGDWATGIEKVDAGTKWLIYDKRTGQKIGEEVKDIRGAASEQEIGTAEGKATSAAVGDVATADTTLGYIDSLRNHPGREWGSGGSAYVGMIPGTNAKEFQLEVERLKSGAFLTAINELRGMGALSNAEGQTATAAIAALDPYGTEEGFLKRLAEYEEIVKLGRERASKRISAPVGGTAGGSPSASPAATSSAPPVATVIDGYSIEAMP